MQCAASAASSPATAATGDGGAPTVLPRPEHDVNNGLTELELLRRIYNEICEIRQKHSEVIAMTAAKKAEVSSVKGFLKTHFLFKKTNIML